MLTLVGSLLKSDWSSKLVIIEVLYIIKKQGCSFYGLRVDNVDKNSGDWPDNEGLLWVYKEGQAFRICQECKQRPRFIEGQPEYKIREIIGHYFAETGSIYYAILWVDYTCPTWELEDDLESCSQLVTEYYEALINVE